MSMNEHTIKERYTEYNVLSVIIAVLLFIFALFLALATSSEAEFSLSGITLLFRNNPAFWLVVIFTLMFPFGVYFINRKLTLKLNEKQRIIDSANSRIDHVKEFTEELIQGNFEVDCKLDETDSLGDALVNLRKTLKSNDENGRKLRKAEEERNWIAEGLAHFSETLRNFIHEPEQLSFHIIKDLTRYVSAIQGGFYTLEDQDSSEPFFNLAAFFAYDRRKFADQKIKWGDGLVGTCAMEKKTIYLKNVPENYITVTSGLGQANPDSLLVVPMMHEEKILGVLEFASFSKFETNHITLIEKTAESIGATLSAIKTNIRTARLLEESKAQTQILTSHEEEMRQNMEELQATQEESLRQNQRLVFLEETLKQNILLAEINSQGVIISGNSLIHKKLEFGTEIRIEGKQITELIDGCDHEWFGTIWHQLVSENKSYKGYIKFTTRTGKDLWIMASLSNILHDDQTVAKVMLLGIDANAEKNREQKQEAVVRSINNTGINLELDINGNFLSWNQNFEETFHLTGKELKSMVIFDIVHQSEADSFNKRWDTVIHGAGFTGIFKARGSKGEEVWLKGSFSINENTAHEIEHVLFAGTDISNERRLETELQKTAETLKKQEKQLRDAEKEQGNRLRELKAEMMALYREAEKARSLNEKMLEETADAIVSTSHDNRITFFNKAAEKLWEIDRNEVLNHDIGLLFPETVTEKDELLASFVRPGNHKITGKRQKAGIIDKKGKHKAVYVLLTKARAENENAYMAFFQLI